MVIPFEELLGRVRTGDTTAIRQFVDEYEPFIRRSIRPRLARANLRAAADSVDVCQSVLGSFLIRVLAGEYALDSREDLERLLSTITQRKFAALARREFADRRDRRRVSALLSSGQLIDPQAQPGEQAMVSDLLEEIQRRLTEEERQLLNSRQAGQNWEEIALATGTSAVLLRKRLSRALNRISIELGFENADE